MGGGGSVVKAEVGEFGEDHRGGKEREDEYEERGGGMRPCCGGGRRSYGSNSEDGKKKEISSYSFVCVFFLSFERGELIWMSRYPVLPEKINKVLQPQDPQQ